MSLTYVNQSFLFKGLVVFSFGLAILSAKNMIEKKETS